MTPAQARALLALIADLYQLASAPEPKPEPVANGARAVSEDEMADHAG